MNKLRQKRRLLRKQSNHDEDLFARRILGGAIDLGVLVAYLIFGELISICSTKKKFKFVFVIGTKVVPKRWYV